MIYKLLVEFDDSIDSIELYDELEAFGLNVTDMIKYTIVYGDVDFVHLEKVLSVLDKFSYTKLSLERKA